MIETGATLVGRGIAAGMQGAGALADRAAEKTGITSPAAARRVAGDAVDSTMTMARSAAKATGRTVTKAARAANRARRAMARPAKKSRGKKAGSRKTARARRVSARQQEDGGEEVAAEGAGKEKTFLVSRQRRWAGPHVGPTSYFLLTCSGSPRSRTPSTSLPSRLPSGEQSRRSPSSPRSRLPSLSRCDRPLRSSPCSGTSSRRRG